MRGSINLDHAVIYIRDRLMRGSINLDHAVFTYEKKDLSKKMKSRMAHGILGRMTVTIYTTCIPHTFTCYVYAHAHARLRLYFLSIKT